MSEPPSPPELKATLFDQPLSIVCEEDNLPKAILVSKQLMQCIIDFHFIGIYMLIRSINCISSLQDILTILRIQGPLTEGVFRKAANEKFRKELKEDLNYGRDLDLKSKSVHLLAVVFKVMYENYLFS